jgi:excisionase family DNA binding protein
MVVDASTTSLVGLRAQVVDGPSIHHPTRLARDTAAGMALAFGGTMGTGEWLPLTRVAEELGVTRSAVYLMVMEHRLGGMQCGARWVVRREEVERFRSQWRRPPNAGRRLRRQATHAAGPEQVLALLQDWGDATVDELAEAIGRHPGNVRKYLRLLEVRGLAARPGTGTWTPTALGEPPISERGPDRFVEIAAV